MMGDYIDNKNGTITFATADGNFRFTVRDNFPAKRILGALNSYELVNDHHLIQYLHNEVGPAMENLLTGRNEYFLNGEQIEKEKVERIKHNKHFNESIEESIIRG
jgi:hypothetical protein